MSLSHVLKAVCVKRVNKNVYICTFAFIGTSVTRAERQKQPEGPTADERTHELWFIHTIEYYSALKKEKKILTRATTCVNREDMMLSEINPSQKDGYDMVPLT